MYHELQNPKPSSCYTLNLDIPGLTTNLSVRFPDGRLPVCGRCKKNYKTRDMCRGSQGEHTALPWSTVFICVTLDHTCTDANNNLRKGSFLARNMDWMPYCYKNEVTAKTLICSACKTKNYTRKQCRVKSRHRFLPWSTVYVTLSCDTNNTTDRDPEDLIRSGAKRSNANDDDESDHRPGKRRAVGDENDKPVKLESSDGDRDGTSNKDVENETDDVGDMGDDISKVDKSRTFLLGISVDTCNIKWLDYDRSKALPGQNFLQDASMVHHRGLAAHQAQMYVNPPGRQYPYSAMDAANSQMFAMDAQQRSFQSQLYMHHAAGYPNWQGVGGGFPVSMASHNNNSVGRVIAKEQDQVGGGGGYQHHSYWDAERHLAEQHAQANAHAGGAVGYQASFDPDHLVQQHMAASQARVISDSYQSHNQYSDHDPENAHYNASQQQPSHHRNEINNGT